MLWVRVFGKPLCPVLLHWRELGGRSESSEMAIPKVKKFLLVPGVLQAAGRVLEEPIAMHGLGGATPQTEPWDQPSLPTASLLVPGTHTWG